MTNDLSRTLEINKNRREAARLLASYGVKSGSFPSLEEAGLLKVKAWISEIIKIGATPDYALGREAPEKTLCLFLGLVSKSISDKNSMVSLSAFPGGIFADLSTEDVDVVVRKFWFSNSVRDMILIGASGEGAVALFDEEHSYEVFLYPVRSKIQ